MKRSLITTLSALLVSAGLSAQQNAPPASSKTSPAIARPPHVLSFGTGGGHGGMPSLSAEFRRGRTGFFAGAGRIDDQNTGTIGLRRYKDGVNFIAGGVGVFAAHRFVDSTTSKPNYKLSWGPFGAVGRLISLNSRVMLRLSGGLGADVTGAEETFLGPVTPMGDVSLGIRF